MRVFRDLRRPARRAAVGAAVTPRDLARAKRAMLVAAFEQNVLEIEGRRPALERRPWWRGRVASAALVLAGFGVASYVLATISQPRIDASSASAATLAMAYPDTDAVAPAATAPLRANTPRSDAGLLSPAAAVTSIDPTVFPVAIRRIVLDPGHGGRNPGTTTPAGLLEKDITLDIAARVRTLLIAAGYDVLMTRQTDRDVSLEERARVANEEKADVFVSIHVNWIETRQTRAVETYYLGPTDDPYLTALAARENQQSGYSMADLRRLLDAVYADVRRDASRELASSVQRELLASLRRANPSLEDRGVKTAPFVVLVATGVPAILAEVSCLSNAEEAALLSREDYRQDIAQALFAGIRGYATHFDLQSTPSTAATASAAPAASGAKGR